MLGLGRRALRGVLGRPRCRGTAQGVLLGKEGRAGLPPAPVHLGGCVAAPSSAQLDHRAPKGATGRGRQARHGPTGCGENASAPRPSHLTPRVPPVRAGPEGTLPARPSGPRGSLPLLPLCACGIRKGPRPEPCEVSACAPGRAHGPRPAGTGTHRRRPPSREGPVMPRSAGWSGPAAVSMVTARIRWLLSRGRDTARPAAVERSPVQASGALPRAGRAQPSHAARAPGTPCPQPPLLLPPREPPASSSSLLSPASGVDAGRHGDPHWAASSVSSQTVCVHTDPHLPVSVTCTPDDER